MKLGPEDVVGHSIHVAQLEVLSEMVLLDLTLNPEAIADLACKGEDYDVAEVRYRTMAALTFPMEHEYAITRALADFVQDKGFHGLVHSSAMRYVSGTENPRNLALFGNPVSDGKLMVRSINRVMVGSVRYDYALGPAFELK